MSYYRQDEIYARAVLRVMRAYDAQLKPLGDLALAALDAKKGEHIADIGCGAAQTCLQLGGAVGPSGSVLGVELSPMIATVAAQRVAGARHVRIVNADAGTYAFDAGRYDGLFSRFGIMAFADPVAAFGNLRRGLKVGGRVAFVCWRSFEENELDHLPFYAAEPFLRHEDVEAAQAAGPFSFADAGTVRAVLEGAGFGDVMLDAHDVSVMAGDIDETLELCMSAGSLGSLVRRAPSLREQVVGHVREALATKAGDDDLSLDAAVWVVQAQACN